ncbi:MAG: oxaloacetate decarboxylase [Anaerovoracaceae bacterium]
MQHILASAMTFAWNVNGLLTTLPVMFKGMLGIFTVIIVIWLFIALLNKVTGKKNKSDD